ncbi:MAG: LURP-one-related family protein [Oscillospiraceae bacterium]|nr:LURP-one-related family protein [Oscillospiraceae bacterium]
MTLYMKQKVLAFKDRFYITDEKGNNVLYVEGELFSLGKKLHIYDMQNKELALVQQRLLTLLPKFSVMVEGEEVAEIVKELTLFRPRYKVKGPGWTVDGDIWDHDYKIRKGLDAIIHVSKAWLSWGDTYKIDIDKGINPVMAIAVVLAIDCVLDAEGADVDMSVDNG